MKTNEKETEQLITDLLKIERTEKNLKKRKEEIYAEIQNRGIEIGSEVSSTDGLRYRFGSYDSELNLKKLYRVVGKEQVIEAWRKSCESKVPTLTWVESEYGGKIRDMVAVRKSKGKQGLKMIKD